LFLDNVLLPISINFDDVDFFKLTSNIDRSNEYQINIKLFFPLNFKLNEKQTLFPQD